MKLRDQIKKLPQGAIISVEPQSMTLVRYHARGCRDIVTRANLKTGKRDVLLGALYRSANYAAGGDFYNGVEWLACWLLDNVEGETITEEQLRPWAAKAWAEHLKGHNDKLADGGHKTP